MHRISYLVLEFVISIPEIMNLNGQNRFSCMYILLDGLELRVLVFS